MKCDVSERKTRKKKVRNILHFYFYIPVYNNRHNLRQDKLGQVRKQNLKMQEWTVDYAEIITKEMGKGIGINATKCFPKKVSV